MSDAKAPVKEKKVRKASQGPRPLYLVFTVKDADGNVIPDAVVDFATASRNASIVLAAVAGDSSRKYGTINVE